MRDETAAWYCITYTNSLTQRTNAITRALAPRVNKINGFDGENFMFKAKLRACS